jgi:hypothetical protein
MNKRTDYYRKESNDRNGDWMWKMLFFPLTPTSDDREQYDRRNDKISKWTCYDNIC